MTAATKHLSYYFKAYEGDKKIAVEVKATPKGETYTLTKKFELTKSGESDTDGGLLDLEHGDAFKINLSPSNTSDGTVANPTESNFNITAELKWNNRSEEVEIPIDVVDTSAPSTDEDKDDDADAENGPVLTPSINDVNTWELDLTDGEFATILVNIQAPATIQKLIVNISSDNEDFASTVKEGMNMGEFDLCNITDPTTEENVVSLEMPYNDDIKGLSQFTFDISGFSGALTLFEGTHYFTITVEDGNGERSSGTLTVRVTL
jgi:hypothetical protein